MIRHLGRALVIVGVLGVAPLPDPAAEVPDAQSAKAKEFVRQADELWHLKKDYNGALAAFNQAVDAAPDDNKVRLERALFFEAASVAARGDDQAKFRELARADYRRITDAHPDSVAAGVARDQLSRLSGKPLLTPAVVTCPPEATEAFHRAEALFAAQHYDESLPDYEKATAGCPTAGTYWIGYADAHYVMGRYETARELFRKALTVDPWNRMGHLFLADAEWKLKNVDPALHEAVLAVVSDPTFEAGWARIRNLANVTGRRWERRYAKKVEVKASAGDGDKQKIDIILNSDQISATGDAGVVASSVATDSGTKRAAPAEAGAGAMTPDAPAWMTYSLAKSLVLGGTVLETDAAGKTVERKVDPTTMTALEIERIAVAGAFLVGRDLAGAPSGQAGPFWSMMDRAERAGFLNEAIFLHLLDAPLAAEYPAFREKNSARLVEYLETVIVPKSDPKPEPEPVPKP